MSARKLMPQCFDVLAQINVANARAAGVKVRKVVRGYGPDNALRKRRKQGVRSFR
jgi:hypothetical protein